MDTIVIFIAVLSLLGAALMAGVFYAFSTFVMKALAVIPASAGMAAMQSINVVVINAMFLGVFLGTAFLSAANIVLASFDWQAQSIWIMSGSVLYFVGTFLVTVVFNVPLNNRLANEPANDPAGHAVWQEYLGSWTFWNHVRTVAALLATAMFALGLIER